VGRNRFFLFMFLILIQGCSVQKNTLMTRVYHNLTAHYNIFFNARESYRKGLAKANKQYQENFTRFIPVFPEDNPQNVSVMGSDMDRVIRKTSKLISNHSIKAKPETKGKELSPREELFYNKPEYNKWVDDSYLLLGKAHFRKNELQSALQTFSYISSTFTDPEVIARAKIWTAKTFDALKRYDNAEKVLLSLDENIQELPSRLQALYYAVFANHYLLRNKPDKAFPALEKAYQNSGRKKNKYRYAFLLGQLAYDKGENMLATSYFKKVLKLKPDYNFAFNARILLAESSGITGENVKQVKKDLNKLLRDKKNKEYKDQIYYAFGQIALNEKKENEAIDYFKKSAVSSVDNMVQKTESYLAIAHLSFNHNNYLQAQQYYDSAVQIIPQDFPDYDNIRVKSKSLNSLAGYVRQAELQDSLQRLAAMSSAERLGVIDKIIEQVREEERKAREEQLVPNYTPGMEMQTQMRFQDELQRGGKWYFYNPSALGFGRTEFKRKWGTRRLEDNWRRKNKMSVNFSTSSTEEQGDSIPVKSAPAGNKTSRSYYLKQIPLSDSMMIASNQQLMEGLFESALIYKNDFQNPARAEKNLKELVTRFPGTENKYLLSAYFTLYQIFKESGDVSNQEKYKELIISKFPDSEQAKILSDPLYLQKIYNEEKEAEQRYAQTYQCFLSGDYDRALALCDQYLNQDIPPKLISRYLFLKAQATGEKGDIRTYKQALQQVTTKASDPEIVARAKEIINYLNALNPVLKEEELVTAAREIYHFSADGNQRLVIISPENGININQLRFDLLNFNTDYDPQHDLPVKEHDVYKDTTVLSVQGIGKILPAMKYYRQLQADTAMVKYFKDSRISFFLFSDENFNTFVKDKSVDTYRVFFEKYYLQGIQPEKRDTTLIRGQTRINSGKWQGRD